MMRRAARVAALGVCLLLTATGRAWGGFVDPTPGAEIQPPGVVAAPAVSAPPAPPYPTFERSREGIAPRGGADPAGAPSTVVASDGSNPRAPSSERHPARAQWSRDPRLTLAAALVIVLLGLAPLLWIRRAATSASLPRDFAPHRWQGWTQRPHRSSSRGLPDDNGGM